MLSLYLTIHELRQHFRMCQSVRGSLLKFTYRCLWALVAVIHKFKSYACSFQLNRLCLVFSFRRCKYLQTSCFHFRNSTLEILLKLCKSFFFFFLYLKTLSGHSEQAPSFYLKISWGARQCGSDWSCSRPPVNWAQVHLSFPCTWDELAQ